MKYAVSVENADLYLGRKQILYNINLNIRQGEHCFILGSNGAGKTTLTRMILGYIWPKYGSKVTVLSNIFGHCDIFEVRKKIAWISPFLTSWISKGDWTVKQIVLSGKDSTIGLYRKTQPWEDEKVDAILSKLEINYLADKKFDVLSSGEQIKVLIAKALYSTPEIIILDEACVHLDIQSRENFLSTLKVIADSNKSLTIIFITQRIEDITPIFNSGVLIKDGKIIDSGSRKSILNESNLKKVFGIDLTLVCTKNDRYWPIVN